MKRIVEALSEEQIRQTHPLTDLAPGWFFRVAETSNLVWMAEGKDQWGRLVSCRGSDDEEALRLCVEQALELDERTSRS